MSKAGLNLRRFVDCEMRLGEGPLWCPVTQRLWWLDVADPHVYCADSQGQLLHQWKVPKYPGAIFRVEPAFDEVPRLHGLAPRWQCAADVSPRTCGA